jgi:outer membrane protein TolC
MIRLKERIQGYYLSVLLLSAQIKQLETGRKDIIAALERTDALVKNGAALPSAYSAIKAELLRMEQRLFELKSGRNTLLEIINIYSGLKMNENTPMGIPKIQRTPGKGGVRPEERLLNLQDSLLSRQNKLISAKNLPRISAFAQGGYGKPGLNMLDNKFNTFYMKGIRLNWQLNNLYTMKNERQLVAIQRKNVTIQKEIFEMNQNAQLQQLYGEIEKYWNYMETDKEIIQLKQDVLNSTRAQYENGSISYVDYLRELNAEEQARENLEIHTYQLIQAQINYKTIQGN